MQVNAELRILCTSSTPSPPQVCLGIEKLDPLSIEYEDCLNRHGKMTERDYQYKYNFCLGQNPISKIFVMEENSSLRFFQRNTKKCEKKNDQKKFEMVGNKCLIEEIYDFSFYVSQIKEDHMKKKSYWKWAVFKTTKLNLFDKF